MASIREAIFGGVKQAADKINQAKDAIKTGVSGGVNQAAPEIAARAAASVDAYDEAKVGILNAIKGGADQATAVLTKMYQNPEPINTMATTYLGNSTTLDHMAGIAINAGFKSVMQDWETQQEINEAQKKAMIGEILNGALTAVFFLPGLGGLGKGVQKAVSK